MTESTKHKISYIKVKNLIPYTLNSRTHSDDQVKQIASSINEFGFTNPLLVTETGSIIAGHGRLLAANLLGMDSVPCIKLTHLTEAQTKAYVIADNKLALNAGWDDELLAIEFEALKELDFDLELTGFSKDEIDSLCNIEVVGNTDEDAVPEPPETPVTVLGDIWTLGNHRLMCGDSTSIDAVELLMDGNKIDMVFTDPPYGISIVQGKAVGGSKPFGSKGSVGGKGLVEVGTYEPVANDDSIDVAVSAISVIATLNASVEIIWGGNYYANSLPNSSCWIVWDKKNSGNFADCELAWTNQKTAVRKFEHMWNGMIKASEHGQKRVHPTQKPIALAEWCIDSYGEECNSVLDLFGGSGFTLMGCETRKKTAYIMELSEAYCDVIINRWQNFTGHLAVHTSSGLTYNEMKAK